MQSGTRHPTPDEKLIPVFLHEDPWNLLRLYHVYRFTLAGAFLIALVMADGNIKLGNFNHDLFVWLTGAYLVLAVISNLA